VASDPHRSNEGAWSELERGFFATAPPDVPEPPPEPMRFDDLDPIAPTPPQWRARLARAGAATSGARRMLRFVTPVLSAAARTTLRGGRSQVVRLSVMLRNISRDRRLVAVAAATLLVVTSISAAVVASRDSARKPAGSTRAELAASARPVVSEAARPAPAAAAAFEEDDPSPSAGAIVTEVSPPTQRKRGKHAKGSVRHGAHAKAPGKYPASSATRPASRR
jgi:hypothetical protein